MEFKSNINYRAGLIMIVEEKHGPRYFDASNVNKAGAAARMILEERLGEGWYDVEEEPKQPSIDRRKILGLPKDRITETIRQAWEQYDLDLKQYDFDNEFNATVQKALTERDDRLAVGLLQYRSSKGYEYEGIRFVELEEVSL